MTLQVFTARIGLVDRDAFDITRKSGGPRGEVFAPSWGILAPALAEFKTAADEIGFAGCAMDTFNGESRQRRAWWAYVPAYLAEMRFSYRHRRRAWDELLARPRVVLLCYCPDPNRCHRTVLGAGILPRLGAEYEGEIDADTRQMLEGFEP